MARSVGTTTIGHSRPKTLSVCLVPPSPSVSFAAVVALSGRPSYAWLVRTQTCVHATLRRMVRDCGDRPPVGGYVTSRTGGRYMKFKGVEKLFYQFVRVNGNQAETIPAFLDCVGILAGAVE